MTTSTSRPASAAATASCWPRRNAGKPNSSCSAPSGSVDRATGAGGSGPRPGRVRVSSVSATGTDDHTSGPGGIRRGGTESSHLDERQRVLEGVLGLRGRLGLRQRVLAGEAGVAVGLALAVDGGVD